MYVGEHTSQAASVGSVRQRRTDPARSGLRSPLVGKGFAFFDKLTPPRRSNDRPGGAFFCGQVQASSTLKYRVSSVRLGMVPSRHRETEVMPKSLASWTFSPTLRLSSYQRKMFWPFSVV